MKRVADEGKPVVLVPLIVKPVEVGVALCLVPPDSADVLLTLERSVPNTIRGTVP